MSIGLHRINLQRSRQPMLYEFELGFNTAETATNICWSKDDGEINDRSVTRSGNIKKA